MNRRHAAAALWTLQWSLAATFFLLGLLEASLPEADLRRLHLAPAAADPGVAGLIVVPAALSLVIPSVTRFWPGLSPLAGPAHLAVGHVLPLVLLVAAGALLGQRLLRLRLA